MMESMRNAAKGWVAKVLIGLLALSFGVWGIADVFRGSATGALATVGKQEIAPEQFSNAFREYLQNYARQTGRGITIGAVGFQIADRDGIEAGKERCYQWHITAPPLVAEIAFRIIALDIGQEQRRFEAAHSGDQRGTRDIFVGHCANITGAHVQQITREIEDIERGASAGLLLDNRAIIGFACGFCGAAEMFDGLTCGVPVVPRAMAWLARGAQSATDRGPPRGAWPLCVLPPKP
jgi:hypothetical protein